MRRARREAIEKAEAEAIAAKKAGKTPPQIPKEIDPELILAPPFITERHQPHVYRDEQ